MKINWVLRPVPRDVSVDFSVLIIRSLECQLAGRKRNPTINQHKETLILLILSGLRGEDPRQTDGSQCESWDVGIETTEILSAHEHYKKEGSDPLDWVCTQYTHLDYKGFKPIYLLDYTPLPGQESPPLERSSVFVSRKSNRCIRYSWLGPKHPHYHAKRNSRLQYSDLALFN